MTATKDYSAMLYELADRLEAEKALNSAGAERVREAAQRLDEQTITISLLRKDRDGLATAVRTGLEAKFLSMNGVAVERATVKAAEWAPIEAALARIEARHL